MMDTHRVRNM